MAVGIVSFVPPRVNVTWYAVILRIKLCTSEFARFCEFQVKPDKYKRRWPRYGLRSLRLARETSPHIQRRTRGKKLFFQTELRETLGDIEVGTISERR